MAASVYRLEDARQATRVKIPPMYTLLRARIPGETRYQWTGHIYDISTAGMRFELDTALPEDAIIEIRAMLPGKQHIQFRATARVVRIHDAEAGPVRMSLAFETFHRRADQRRLENYLAVQTGKAEADLMPVRRRRAA